MKNKRAGIINQKAIRMGLSWNKHHWNGISFFLKLLLGYSCRLVGNEGFINSNE